MNHKDLIMNCTQFILLVIGMAEQQLPCSPRYLLLRHCLLMHWTGFSDTALLAIAGGPGTPVSGWTNQIIPPWNLPTWAKPEGPWSVINVSTLQCFLVFSVKYVESRLCPEKFRFSRSGLDPAIRVLTNTVRLFLTPGWFGKHLLENF